MSQHLHKDNVFGIIKTLWKFLESLPLKYKFKKNLFPFGNTRTQFSKLFDARVTSIADPHIVATEIG